MMINDTEVVKRYMEGDSLQKIARDTGKKYNAVRNVVHAAGVVRLRGESNSKAGRTEKPCGKCKKVFSISNFHTRKYPTGTIGLTSYCKPCQMQYMRTRNYGLTTEQYDEMFANQDGKCAICGAAPEPEAIARYQVLHIDHDHETNLVRELLCWRCNCGLGNFGDDVDRIASALVYLTKHKSGGQ